MEQFLASFPGAMAQFRVGTGNEALLLRQCSEATRDLHPAEDCFRATGWTCTPLPAINDETGRTWSRFTAEHPDGRIRAIRQCYVAIAPRAVAEDLDEIIADNRSWPDVSSWYWAAALPGSSVKMTLAITVATTESAGGH